MTRNKPQQGELVLSDSDADRRIAWLRAEIARHNKLYYVDAAPILSDREYDALYRELEDLEKRNPERDTAASPTHHVGGAPLTQFEHVHHAIPMMSLANTYAREELIDFDTRLQRLLPAETDFSYVLEPKIDGVAISLRYEEGRLSVASTRGDGKTGDDITANIRTIQSIPRRLQTDDPPPVLEVRGEVFMDKAGFLRINAQREEDGLDTFANPRNAAAGSLKQLDSAVVAERPLDAILYGLGEVIGVTFPSHHAMIDRLSRWGFKVPTESWHCSDMAAVLNSLDALEAIRHDFPFEIDGGVIKVDERELYDLLGSTAKSPRWAVAYKYEPEQEETIIRDITIQVGRTGVLTPVAELEPVPISGSVVSRATLHNADEIKRKDIRIGDHVVVEKAGEVIPAIVRVNTDARKGDEAVFTMPSRCPVCGQPATQRENEVALRCENMQCQAQLKRWVRHFAARGAMDIEGLGNVLVEQLVDAGLVNNPADLYSLTLDQVAELERMGQKSAEKLVSAIAKSKGRDFWRCLFALGIRHIGARSAQILEAHFTDIDAVIQATADELEALQDVGPVVARSIVDFFREPRNVTLVERFKTAGLTLSREAATAAEMDDRFDGATFVLTGTLSSLTRDAAAEKIRQHGGKVSSSVSAKTTYLLAGEKAGSKLTKAEKLNVTVLTEAEFLTLLS